MIQTPRPDRPLCEADVEEAEADLDELIEARLAVLGGFLVRCISSSSRHLGASSLHNLVCLGVDGCSWGLGIIQPASFGCVVTT